MPERVIKTIDGKRGGFLFLTGIMISLLGLSQIIYQTPTRAAAFEWAAPFISQDTVGWAFLLGGLFALIIGTISRRVPAWVESMAFVVLATSSAVGGLVHGTAWLFGHSPNSWTSAVIYTFYTLLVLHVSDWENPRKTTRQLRRESTGETPKIEDA